MQTFGVDGLLSAVQRDIDGTFPPGTTVYSDDFYPILYECIGSYLVYNADIERWAEELGLDPEDYTVGEMMGEVSNWITEELRYPDGYTEY